VIYQEFNDEQRRIYVDTIQSYQSLLEARSQANHYSGYMAWKKSKDREYLFKGRATARGLGKSLGLRDKKTESQYAAFYKGKGETKNRVGSLETRVKLQSKYALANKLNRVPKEATQICRVLNNSGCTFSVVGSNALYGYEALSGIVFEPEVIATRDIDILLDTRTKYKTIYS